MPLFRGSIVAAGRKPNHFPKKGKIHGKARSVEGHPS